MRTWLGVGLVVSGIGVLLWDRVGAGDGHGEHEGDQESDVKLGVHDEAFRMGF